MIGQFARPVKIQSRFCYQNIHDLSPSVLNFYSKEKSKTFLLL